MALGTFNELQASLAAWLHRSDLTAMMPDFIRLAESRLQNDLEARQLDATSTVNLTAATATAALPTDFNTMRSVYYSSGGNAVTLDPVTPDYLARFYPATAGTSKPVVYAIQGSLLLLGPTPDAAYVLNLLYMKTITPLGADNPTNAILSAYPEAYLHAALIFAGQYLRDADMVQGLEQLYAADVARINAQNWGTMSNMAVRTC